MSSIRHVVCGVDGSEPARSAAVVALRLADRLGDRLVLMHVIPPRPAMPPASFPIGPHPVTSADMHELNRIEAERAFASVERDVRPATADRLVEHGDAADRLSAVAWEKDARLIVVGASGRSSVSAALLGSVSAELAARAPRPVVVVSGAQPESGGAVGGIVCGVDGSARAAAVAATAARLASALDSSLMLVCVDAEDATGDWSHKVLTATSAHAGEAPHLERLSAVGDPANALARVAFEHKAALLLVGCRGRGPIRSAIAGSVSAALTRLAPCPLVIVPPEAEDAGSHGQAISGSEPAA